MLLADNLNQLLSSVNLEVELPPEFGNILGDLNIQKIYYDPGKSVSVDDHGEFYNPNTKEEYPYSNPKVLPGP